MCTRGAGIAGLHPLLQQLRHLVGTWSGAGRGGYPSVASPFAYQEEVSFAHVGKPFLAYSQRTWSTDAQGARVPMHAESGYLRVVASKEADADRVNLELMVADPTGLTHLYEGQGVWHRGGSIAVVQHEPPTDGALREQRLDCLELLLRTTSVAVSSSAKQVTAVERRWRLHVDPARDQRRALTYVLGMEAVGLPMQYHLDAELTPADADLPVAQARLDPTTPTVLIDVRERDEYQAGHLAGAVNIPMGQMLRDAGREGAEARTLIQQARADAGRVVFYCGSGVRARLTATQLRTSGLTHLFYHPEGFAQLKTVAQE